MFGINFFQIFCGISIYDDFFINYLGKFMQLCVNNINNLFNLFLLFLRFKNFLNRFLVFVRITIFIN